MNQSTINKVADELKKRGITINNATIEEVLKAYSKVYVQESKIKLPSK